MVPGENSKARRKQRPTVKPEPTEGKAGHQKAAKQVKPRKARPAPATTPVVPPSVQPGRVVNVRKAQLIQRGFRDFAAWNEQENTLYIGRSMALYVPGTFQSKWANPFQVKKFSREEVLQMYEKHLRESPRLMASLGELEGKELGCWCHPEGCHGDILLRVAAEVKGTRRVVDLDSP
mmetsp:Transcript_18333/g.40504  ORF Transcript_18333/g.40504 Transcript_18333/m.40504 type:complete len:177 (+) Transcript_18333:24-554(+)